MIYVYSICSMYCIYNINTCVCVYDFVYHISRYKNITPYLYKKLKRMMISLKSVCVCECRNSVAIDFLHLY